MEYIDPEFIISHVLNKNQPDKYNTLTQPLNHSNKVLNSVNLDNINQINRNELNRINKNNIKSSNDSIRPNISHELLNSTTPTKNNVDDISQSNDIYLTSSNIIIILIVIVVALFMLLMIMLYKLYHTQTKLTKIKNKYMILKLKTQEV